MDLQLASNLEELEKLFSSRMADYEDKLNKCAAGTSSVHPDITSLSREFTEFKSFVWQTLNKLKTQMELLALGLDRHETFMRRKVLLFHGLPEKDNEKVHERVLHIISNQMKETSISMDNLHVCHRLGSFNGKCRPILVRFHDIQHRQVVWEGKTALKGTGITISEFLTQARHKAFMAARKHFGVKNCWTVEGKIMVLLPNKSRRKIESLAELQILVAQYPPETTDAACESSQTQLSPKNAASKGATAARKTRRR
ncbi:uncharacterized protein [Epargyreus clarus]|uniref:uncharacterized protein n=1 Tax=Epargyreus clarus TaxID=520877 RepID=UPI003C2FFC7F